MLRLESLESRDTPSTVADAPPGEGVLVPSASWWNPSAVEPQPVDAVAPAGLALIGALAVVTP